MARYKVLLIRRGIKIGQVIPYGDSKEITIIGVYNKVDARKRAKEKAGTNWAIVSVKPIGTLDPDAR